MKVFWSWQSDTPGKTGRHFVRSALEQAIGDLKDDIGLDEPTRDDLHLDHDRKGVPGSPDLARVILDKISKSAVFVADVTPVGKTKGDKSLTNPNVAIELGYALAIIGDDALLMVMNDAYGPRDSLPFDLRHKAGPVIFHLPQNASKDEILEARKSLVGNLRTAIRLSLHAVRRLRAASTDNGRKETPATTSCAQYFKPSEVLIEREIGDGRTIGLRYGSDRLLYLRVIPTVDMPQLLQADLGELVYGIKVPPLHTGVGGGQCHGRNKYGGITYSYETTGDRYSLLSSTQIFRNRELWGIDGVSLKRGEHIPIALIERVLRKAIRCYLKFGVEHLKYNAPLVVEAGAASVGKFHLLMDRRQWGPIIQSEIRHRQVLMSTEPKEIDAATLAIFQEFFDAAGIRRPEEFGGFPA